MNSAQKILIVQSGNSLINSVKPALDHLYGGKCEIEICSSTECALNLIRSNEFDAIISDLHLVTLSGLALLGLIRQSFINTHFILISPIESHDIENLLGELGAQYLVKPFTENQFLTAMQLAEQI